MTGSAPRRPEATDIDLVSVQTVPQPQTTGARPERWLVCRPAASEAELAEYYAIRKKTFVDEQGLFDRSDVEPVDADPRTLHIVAICEPAGEIVGVVRCCPAENGAWFGGRLTVVAAYRASRLLVGRALVGTAEELVRERGVRVFLGHIQLPIVRFFEHLGWRKVGDPGVFARVPHQLMRPAWSGEPTSPRSSYAAGSDMRTSP
jgi:putative N-acetyltransferase (TIGR04045 family)